MTSHDQVWAYYQNNAPHVFGAAHARLDYLINAIATLTHASRPTILNIGIGDGYLEQAALERGWSVHSLDPSAESVAKLAALGVEAKTGRIDQVPFADEAFDCVVASEVLEHLTEAERQQGLIEIKRVLKPGGCLLGTVPYQEILEDNLAICPTCKEVFHRWGHTTSFDLSTIRNELTPYFSDVRCRSTAFVRFRGRSMTGKLKGLARLLLGRLGATIAVPNIVFVGRKELPNHRPS